MVNLISAAERRMQVPLKERTNYKKNFERKLKQTGSQDQAERYANHISKAAEMRKKNQEY